MNGSYIIIECHVAGQFLSSEIAKLVDGLEINV